MKGALGAKIRFMKKRSQKSNSIEESASKPKANGTSRASKPGKSATKSTSQPKAGVKARPDAGEAKTVKLLSGGNPQIAKADGDAPVQAYITAMPGWKRDVGRRLDALIVGTVPGVRKAVKWNSPLYGVEGQGWFLGIHCFTKYVKVASSAARRCVPSRPASPSKRKCATSTSTRTTRSTKLSSPIGCSKPASCPANECERPVRGACVASVVAK